MTEWEKYTAMAARLGSIPPSKLNALPVAIQKILDEDMPVLLKVLREVVIMRDAICEGKLEPVPALEKFAEALQEVGF